MTIDNLAQANAEIEKLWKRLERLERGAPIGFSSVSRGALRILSEEGLIVDGSASVSGVLDVTGTENVTGTLNVSGTENVTGALGVTGTTTLAGPLIVNGTATITGPNTSVTGPFHIAGNTDITGNFEIRGPSTRVIGPFHVEGATDITGTVLIDGAATLTKRLTVTAPGDIRVGGAIPMTIGNAAVGFDSGGSVVGYSSGVQIDSGGAPDIVVSTGGVSITGVSGAFLTVAGGVRTGGAINMDDLPTISASGRTPNLWINPATGDVYRLV